MNFEDLKDQILEALNRLKAEIQETPIYNTLREKFDTLPSGAQKAIQLGFVLVVALFLISIPNSYFNEAQYQEQKFQETRDLISDLLKAGKPDSSMGDVSRDMSIDRLKIQVNSTLQTSQLISEQIGGLTPGGATEGSLAPKLISEETLTVDLKNLNLTQVVIVGRRLQQMLSNVKLTGLKMNENGEKPGYFNTKFILSKFSLPRVAEDEKAKDSKNKKGRRGKRNKKGK